MAAPLLRITKPPRQLGKQGGAHTQRRGEHHSNRAQRKRESAHASREDKHRRVVLRLVRRSFDKFVEDQHLSPRG